MNRTAGKNTDDTDVTRIAVVFSVAVVVILHVKHATCNEKCNKEIIYNSFATTSDMQK